MKKLLLIISLIFTLSIPAFASGNSEIKVVLDGEVLNFDVPAQIIDGRTMVPMRAIFEKLGATVEWNSEYQVVTAYRPGILLQMPIGNTTISKNSVNQTIDVPAMLVNNRTLVPVRVVSESMGAIVDWEQETQTVYITSTDNIQYIDWNDTYYYWGEVVANKAYGYGMLYLKSNDSIMQIGKYVNDQIVAGTDYFNNGDIFIGDYLDGMRSYGTYLYANGEIYIGEFRNSQKHGYGIYYFLDGTSYTGQWANDVPLEFGNHNQNNNGYVTIPNTSQSSYQAELAALNEWYDEEAAEIEEFAASDPLDTSWGKDMMETFEKNAQKAYDDAYAQSAAMTGGFSNSYAITAAEQQKENFLAQGKSTVKSMFQTEINNRWDALDAEYDRKLYALKIKYGY